MGSFMKIKKQKTMTKKKIIVASLLFAALLVAALAYFFYSQRTQNNDTSHQPAASDKLQAKDLAKKPENKQSSPNTDTPQPPTTSEQKDKAAVQMTASADISGDMVYIRGGINNAVVSDGSCYAQLNGSNGESIRKDTTLLQNPSTTDCKTISLNSSDLGKGVWSVKLYYSSNTMEGTSSVATFEIK